jgi:hypothetical protein
MSSLCVNVSHCTLFLRITTTENNSTSNNDSNNEAASNDNNEGNDNNKGINEGNHGNRMMALNSMTTPQHFLLFNHAKIWDQHGTRNAEAWNICATPIPMQASQGQQQ